MSDAKGLVSLGKGLGYPSSTYTEVQASPFLDGVVLDPGMKWRSSVMKRLIMRDLSENFNGIERPQDQYLNRAIAKTAKLFELPHSVKIMHLNDVFKLNQDLDIWSEPPGLPWSQSGYKTKVDIKRDPDAVQSVRRFWHFVEYGRDVQFPDCCAYIKSHTCDVSGEPKVRVVWGYPATVTFGEAVFALPLIKAYKQMPASTRPIAYGFETLTGGVERIEKNRFKGTGKYYVRIVFSKFDKKIPAWLIEIAFVILSLNIDLAHYEDHGIPHARKMDHMFMSIQNYFINTKIRLANGQRYQKRSGIASGSYFTQLIGSIVNSILVHWAHLKQFDRFPNDIVSLGGDSLMSTGNKFDLKRANQLFKSIGMEINEYKSQVEVSLPRVKFLG